MPMPRQLAQAQRSKKPPLSKSKKSGLVLPVHSIWKKMQKGNYSKHIRVGGAVYMTAVLEYLAAELLELAGMTCRSHKKQRINPRHILLAVKNDQELYELLSNVTISQGGVVPFIHRVLLPKKTSKRVIAEDN